MENGSSVQGSRELLLPAETRPCAITINNKPPEFPASRFTFLSIVLWFDQSSRGTALISWSVFFLLVVGAPLISHFLLVCSDCDFHHRRPYDAVVQLSLSLFAGISFVSLSYWSRKFGMRKFLFLDKLWDVSDKVRIEYEAEIQVRTSSSPVFVNYFLNRSNIVLELIFLQETEKLYQMMYLLVFLISTLIFLNWIILNATTIIH